MATDVDMVFLGVLGDNAAAIDKTFDKRIRNALAVFPDAHLADYLVCQEFRRRINFDDFPTVSRRLVESLRQYSSDSTMFIWATLKSSTLKPVRSWIIKSDLVGELTVELNAYSLRFREYAFIGDIHATLRKPYGYIFFYPLEKGVHINAVDRQEVMSALLDDAAFKSAHLVTTLVKSEKTRAVFGTDSTMAQYKAPSISDMFNLPSVEAAKVEVNRKKQSPNQGNAASAPTQSNPAGKTDSMKTK
jgi:hypothetical protein